MNTYRIQTGFTLVEIAISMVILAFLMAGAFSAFSLQARNAQYGQTRSNLEEARNAVLAFAASEGRLPCPSAPSKASSGDFGLESLDGSGQCMTPRGVLPWKKLGLPGSDAWGQVLSYEVSPSLAGKSGKSLSQPGSVLIFESSTATQTLVDAQSVAFAIWSHGRNGREAFTSQGTQQAVSADEDEHGNAPNSTASPLRLVYHLPTDGFDDQILWVSKFIFFKQLLDSGWNLQP